MTLTKVPMAKGNPFLLADEVRDTPKVMIVGEPRVIKTKFKDEQHIVDVTIAKALDKTAYDKLTLKDVEDRLKHNTRTYFINGTSFNYLIDILSDDEKKWNGKEIEIAPLMQVVNGERKEVMYVEGSI